MAKFAEDRFAAAAPTSMAVIGALMVAARHIANSREIIGPQELTSLYAVMAYVADQQGVRQDVVQTLVEAEFSIDRLSKLKRQDYRNAMGFLIDLRMDEIRSRK